MIEANSFVDEASWLAYLHTTTEPRTTGQAEALGHLLAAAVPPVGACSGSGPVPCQAATSGGSGASM